MRQGAGNFVYPVCTIQRTASPRNSTTIPLMPESSMTNSKRDYGSMSSELVSASPERDIHSATWQVRRAPIRSRIGVSPHFRVSLPNLKTDTTTLSTP